MDPELRDALNQVAVDLRGEIRSGDAETRAYVDASIQTSAAETRAYIDERLQASTASLLHHMRESEEETRRHLDVVAESLRDDNRSLAESMVLSFAQRDRRLDEHGVRTDRLEGRVLRLEVRVTGLEDDREPRRPRRLR